jgi:hypothetical protein
MPITNLTTSGIVQRVYLTLPTRFTRETSSQFYNVMYGIGEMFQFSIKYIDELWRQTNLGSASGDYVDLYIGGLINYGRKGKSDEEYKDRYSQILFEHNSTRDGMSAVVESVLGNPPLLMYESTRRGAYYNARYYWNDDVGLTVYGSESATAFIGIIELSRRPDEDLLDELIVLLQKAKASGILIYLKWPNEYEENVDTLSGDYELTEPF